MKAGWEIKRLGEVCLVIAGQSPEGKYYNKNSNGMPFYQGKKEFNEKYLGEPTTWTTNITKEAIKDDVLLSVRAPVGPINFATEKICIGRGLAAIRASNLIDKEFLYNFLLKHETEIVGNAGAVFNSINKAQIENIEIALPPLPEQKRIVAVLDEAFAAIAKAKENAEKNLQNAKALFESYLQNVFENKGKDWEEKSLGEVCILINRGVSPRYVEYKGLCVLNQKCIRNHEINFELARHHDANAKPVNEDKLIQIGDVLVNSTGTGTLGRVAQVKRINLKSTVDTHVTIVRPNKELFQDAFFGYGMIYIENEIAKSGEGASGQTELSRDTLKHDFKICFPKSKKEQEAISKTLDELIILSRELQEVYRKKLNDLEKLKKSVLQKAFSGELKTSGRHAELVSASLNI